MSEEPQICAREVALSDTWYVFFDLRPGLSHLVAHPPLYRLVETAGWLNMYAEHRLPHLKSVFASLGRFYDEEADRPSDGKLLRDIPMKMTLQEFASSVSKNIHLHIITGNMYHGTQIKHLYSVSP